MKAVRFLLRAAVSILACIGATLVIVTFTPLLEWWTNALSGPWGDTGGGTLIVLGSDTTGDLVGEHSYWRCVYAVWAWRGGAFQNMIVSGPESMRDFLVASGVPADRIRMETRSTSTRDNALFTAPLNGDGRAVLLTSDFHMFRAARAFRKAGMDVIPDPVPDAGKRIQHAGLRWEVFIDLVEESAKIAYYRARGWI
jgi:uncharacterized SAM-binding protein YcdF (DUF218 family)